MENETNIFNPTSWQFATVRYELRENDQGYWFPFEGKLQGTTWQWTNLRPSSPFKTWGYAAKFIQKQIAGQPATLGSSVASLKRILTTLTIALLVTLPVFNPAACPSGEGSENDCPGGCCIETDLQ